MKIYLPELYPDELVYSWFSRYAIYSGFVTNSQVLQALYCKEADRTRKEFIGNINIQTRECIKKICSMEQLVLNHTMYPQYARYITLGQKKDTLYKLCYGNYDVCHLFTITPRTNTEQYLKYCPICAMEDRRTYGEAYWHRKHQIRNMMICSKHRCKLENSAVTIKNKDSKFIAAENSIPYKYNCFVIENELQVQFSKYIEDIFDAPMDFENDVPPEAIFYYYMKDTDYMQAGRYRNSAKFINEFYAYYKQIQLSEPASKCGIQNTLVGSMFTFSTVCQIGFFLNIPTKDLTASILSNEQIKQEKETHYVEPNWQQYDTDMAKLMEDMAANIYYGRLDKAGKPGKVMERVVCKKLNIMFHQMKNMPKCRAVLEKYSESYPELWARRLIWAYNLLAKEKGKENFYWTDMKLLTNIVKTKFDETIPYLKKHTDKETANDIIKIVHRIP